MARASVDNGYRAAFTAAARIFAADSEDSDKSDDAVAAYTLAYPTGGCFFAISPAGVVKSLASDITGAGTWQLCVRGEDGVEWCFFAGDAYYAKAFWLGLVAATYSPANVFAEEEPS
jgi:hypothetical protein